MSTRPVDRPDPSSARPEKIGRVRPIGMREGEGDRTRRCAAARLVAVWIAFLVWIPASVAAAASLPRPTSPSTAVTRAPAVSLGHAIAMLEHSAAQALVAPSPPPAAAPEPAPASGQPTDPQTRRAAARPTLLRKRAVPPLWLDYEYTTHRTRGIAFPPIFVHRTPKPGHPEKLLHADLSLTFGWYSERVAKRRWINPVGLFFGSYSERKTVWGAVPLLMGYRRVGEQFNFGQFPLVWWWGTKYVKNFLFAPFHYQQKAPEGFRGVSAVLFWYGHRNLDDKDPENDRKYFVGAPVFWRFQRGLKRFDFAFVYVGGHNKAKGKAYASALPFAWWQSTEFGNRRELWTLGFIRRSDAARRRRVWALPPLLTFRHDDPDKRVFSATPLVWRTKNHLKQSTFTLVGPIGIYRDPRQRNSFAAPVWFRFADKQAGAATNVIVPLAITRRTADKLAVWTLIGGGRKTKNGFAFGIPPLLTFVGKRDDGLRVGTVAGLLWHVGRPASADGPARSLWLAGPLGFSERRGDFTQVGIPPLLTFMGFGPRRNYQVVTPLLWHVRDREQQRRTLVAGPVYVHKNREGYHAGLPPLLFLGGGPRRRYGIVPWLLVGDVKDVQAQTHLTLSPVFVRYKSKDARTLGVLGLGWDVRRPNERHTAVVPLFYHRKLGDTALTVSPIGGRWRTGKATTSVFGPYYRRKTADRNGWGVLPIAHFDTRRVEGGLARHAVVAPLFLRRRTPTDDLDMWSPLVWRSHVRGDRERRGLAVVPFYFRQRQPGGVDVDAGLPFFWSRDRVRRTHTLVVGPGFHRLSRKGLNAGIAPLWWWSDAEDKRRLLALPAIFHFADKSNGEHTTVAIPFWFDRKRANGRRTWSAFPVAFGARRGFNFVRFSLAPPGYFDVFRLRRNTRFTGYVPLLFRYEKCGFQAGDDPKCRYRLWGSFPLFLAGRDGRGRVTHGALAYYFDKRPNGWRLYTPVFGVTNFPGKLLGVYAGIVGVRSTNTHRRVFVFPLYYRKAHRLEDTNLTLVAPPLFIGRHRKDRSFFEAGLLVWQFRQQHKVSTAVVPPVFFLSHAYAQRRIHWFLPLYLRDNNMGKDRTLTAIAPALYIQRRKRENLDFVQFPLVWHIERGENQGTFGAFAWWDIRVKRKTFQMVPGAYFRWSTPEADTKVVGPGLGWWTRGKGETAGDRHWRILFGAFGGGVEDGQRYTAVFGGRIKRRGATARKASGRRRGGRASRAKRRHERRQAARARRLARQSARASRPATTSLLRR